MKGDLDAIALATPSSRDRYVDFLRALSIVVVVVGHWFIGMIYWRRGVVGTTSAIGASSWLWLLTWVAQVMPIFFFVGGFANMVAYQACERRGESTRDFLRTRLVRLLKPSLIFVAAWAAVQIVLHLGNIGAPTTSFLRGVRPPGATVPFGPLWFLGVYVAIVMVSPLTIRLHRRFGLAVPAVLLAGAVLADAVGFVGGRPGVRWANVAFVWLLPHQIGHFYADGRLTGVSRRALAGMALGGLLAMILLTNSWVFGDAGDRWFEGIGHYPRSLLGTDVEPITNTYPPTIALAGMTFWSIGLAMLARPRLSRWLSRDRPWTAVIATNGVIMTLFLWHMTAYLLAILILWPLGFGMQTAASATWWWERPLWIVVPGLFLLGLIGIFGRFERPVRREGRLTPSRPGVRSPGGTPARP
jgi:fucose 4-O-acetylase-like acetyltransferase